MATYREKDGEKMRRQRIAIIGSGIAGLTCAYHLAPHYDLTVYEAEERIGGHTHTVSVDQGGETVRVDTGFIVCNDRTYPHFLTLMDRLGVTRRPTEMSFSVRNDGEGLEYSGGSVAGLFAQRRNLVSPAFWRLLSEIFRFNNRVRKEKENDASMTIGEFLAAGGYSQLFRDNYLLPMISAIWSMGLDSCLDFPLQFFARFFDNHGLLDLTNRPQWYTITGGSSSYLGPLSAPFADRIRTSSPVERVVRRESTVEITARGETDSYDQVILACHGDQALKLIAEPSATENRVLGEFRCNDNDVILHTDTRLLPHRKSAWASWNYQVIEGAAERTALTYNMNILQGLDTRETYLVSLNQPIDERYVLRRFNYRHPVFSLGAIKAQKKWQEVSGADRIHFCGAYWQNGFHEDGVVSGMRVVEMLEGRL